MEYNSAQLRAISHGSGPCLTLAGPGSGKTTVIIRRIQNLIYNLGVPAENILAVTFSRAAAEEMKDRFRDTEEPVTFATFHSIFLRMLREDCSWRTELISERKKRTFMISEIEKYSLPCGSSDELSRDILLNISRIKSGMAIPSSRHISGLPSSCFTDIFKDYETYLKESGLMDFDDIISECLELLSGNPALLDKWRSRYSYILVDEFQDINRSQYEVLRLLAGDRANLFVVGDDDQSIYGFRGASADMMRQFTSDYPSCETILLDINYRCPPGILNPALNVISFNRNRFEKAIFSSGGTGVFTLNGYRTRRKEYEEIITRIKDLAARPGFTIAVLFRNSADSLLFEKMLSDSGVPYINTVNETTDHFVIKDLLSYLRIAACLKEDSSLPCREHLLHIMNRPARYIHRESLSGGSSASGCFRSMLDHYRNNPHLSKTVIRFRNDLSMIAGLPPHSAIKYIRHAVGYEKWLREYASEKGLDFEVITSILDSLEEYASAFSHLRDFLEAMNKDPEERTFSDGCSGTCGASGSYVPVRIMTIHSSKGMEFDAVFLPDTNDSIIPNKKAASEGNLEEERRLLYVAMTRAKKELHISWSERLHNRNAVPSRFIICLL